VHRSQGAVLGFRCGCAHAADLIPVHHVFSALRSPPFARWPFRRMSLDQNLFTLTFTPNADDSTLLDLIDASGVLHYRRQRVPGPTYKMNVYGNAAQTLAVVLEAENLPRPAVDPISESLLTTVSAPSATSKHKTIELFNPNLAVELKYVGTITFKWAFKWEE